ncbi:MAG: hypothetical protein KO464_10390 [Candidatus Methanofastidiosum sp.]|nr:hypothetical protein [Methanofastidiosum sp.]
MVNNEGQLYTIEGIAAAVLILTSAYLMLSATTIFTPGETHIYDMQLEQLGNDVLAVMDTAETWSSEPYPKSQLQNYIEDYNTNGIENFGDRFLELVNAKVIEHNDNLNYNATIYARKTSTNELYPPIRFGGSDYHRENAVVVTRWVNIDNRIGIGSLPADTRNQTVLLEVILWRT